MPRYEYQYTISYIIFFNDNLLILNKCICHIYASKLNVICTGINIIEMAGFYSKLS